MKQLQTKDKQFILLVIAIIILLFIPAPFGLATKGWQAVVLFLGFMISCMASFAPMGTLSLTVLTAVGLLNLTPDSKTLFAVFGSESIWLVIFAFFIAIGFRNTGLGNRIAYQLIKFMGRSVNLLGYSLILCDLLVAPFIPSSNARGAGIGYPISTSMINSLKIDDSAKKQSIASYLSLTSYHGNLLTSTLFLTAMATNPTALSMAKNITDVSISWGQWFLFMIIPTTLLLVIIPLVLSKIVKPAEMDTQLIRQDATERLAEMGKIKSSEYILIGTFLMMILLWTTGSFTGINATVVCMLATCILLFTNVISYQEIIAEKSAWDILLWMAPLLLLTSILNQQGVITKVVEGIQSLPINVSWYTVYILLSLIYVYMHYFFTSTVVHLQVLFLPLLALMISFNVPSTLAVLTLTILTAITPAMTHYGTGTSGLYFSLNYTSQKTWWFIGFIVSLIEVLVFLTVLPAIVLLFT